MTNPLLAPWDAPFALPPFAAIADDDFAPAFAAALAEARARIAAIAADPAPPDFANTVAALETAEETLDRVAGVFFNLAATDANPAREALQRDLAPRLAAFRSEVLMNPALWARVRAVEEAAEAAGLSAEQRRLVTLTARMFRRAGAELEGAAAGRFRQLAERMASLGTAFAQNLLADERDWALPLEPGDLAGLPGDLVGTLAAAAAERGREGHVLTLARSVVVPFLTHSPRRDLRERAFRAWTARGAGGGATDNRAIAAEMLALRAEKARLLGFPSYAAFRLAPEMAGTPDAVRNLLMRVWGPARARAEAEAAALTRLLHADGINGRLEPWDWRFYAERRRRAEFAIDEAEVKPFLSLEAMVAAAFDVAGRLFGLSFRPLDVALHHPDARAWEVRRGGRHMAVFLGDWFARPGKRSGAWCSTFRGQRRHGGERRPVVLNVCNFARPAAGAPALLSWDDARTLFHEFGHALHHILSDVTYGFLAGTSVARDFVELPSQLFEHWLEVPQVLDRHARHAASGAPMPADLRDRLIAARNADTGFATVEYLASALVDLAFHEGTPPADPVAQEAAVLAGIGMPPAIVPRHAAPHFAHVFAGEGYAAGYYSYLWSEVMDADAFAAFEEAGDPFDAQTAARLERHILSAGNSAEPQALYAAFRGRMPGVEALLRGRGLGEAA